MKRLVIIILLITTLGIVNGMVWHKEQLIKNGVRIILALAPADPRSIMQGDYMILRYKFPKWLSENKHRHNIPRFGLLIMEKSIDNSTAKVVKVYGYDHTRKIRVNSPAKLKANQYLMRFKKGRWNQIQLGVHSFFFQQGHGKHYAKAKFADIRVDNNGEFILVDMLNDKLQSIKAIAKSSVKR